MLRVYCWCKEGSFSTARYAIEVRIVVSLQRRKMAVQSTRQCYSPGVALWYRMNVSQRLHIQYSFQRLFRSCLVSFRSGIQDVEPVLAKIETLTARNFHAISGHVAPLAQYFSAQACSISTFHNRYCELCRPDL